jgi:hypothetical protein
MRLERVACVELYSGLEKQVRILPPHRLAADESRPLRSSSAGLPKTPI